MVEDAAAGSLDHGVNQLKAAAVVWVGDISPSLRVIVPEHPNLGLVAPPHFPHYVLKVAFVHGEDEVKVVIVRLAPVPRLL
eukprot:XP_001704094.1 Hypothetical protein GL50803_37066 [Giardia lamblia ATCC 50803]